MTLERLDRRAFLFGLTVTSAGLLVPKAARVFVPPPRGVSVAFDYETSTLHVTGQGTALDIGNAIHKWFGFALRSGSYAVDYWNHTQVDVECPVFGRGHPQQFPRAFQRRVSHGKYEGWDDGR